MKYGIHETMEMHEVLSDAVCMLDHYALYINQCQEQELKSILERQQRHMIDDYHRKISSMQGHGIDISRVPQVRMENMEINRMGSPYSPQQSTPTHTNPDTMQLNDRIIAAGALLFHKCGAARSTNAALECSEPHLRNILASSARSCMEMSHEIFQYMQRQGWYQVPEMPRQFIHHNMQNTYQTTTQHYS